MRSRYASLLTGLMVTGLMVTGLLSTRSEALDGAALRPASATTRSWLVAVERREDAAEVTGELSCTGAEIEPGFVLTAAHCVDGAAAALLRVRAASGEVRGVREYQMHPRYRSSGRGNVYDIAVIELDLPVGGTQFPILAGAGRSTPGTSRGVVHGWAADQAVSATMGTASADAARWYPGFRMRYQTALRGNKNQACFGDSGAPMTRRSRDGRRVVLAGVLSYGDSDCNPQAPVVFTRVETNRGFIASAVRQLRSNPETRLWRTRFGEGTLTEVTLQIGPPGTRIAVTDPTTHLTALAVARGAGQEIVDITACVLSENVSGEIVEFELDGTCLWAGAGEITIHVGSFDPYGNRTGVAVLHAVRP